MALIMLKSQIQGELTKAEARGYERAEREYTRKIQNALDEQRAVYELQIQTLKADVSILESIIDDKDKLTDAAREREINARQIYLKAKEIIDRVDYHYREHLNSTALSSTRFKKIRDEAELFAKNLLPEK